MSDTAGPRWGSAPGAVAAAVAGGGVLGVGPGKGTVLRPVSAMVSGAVSGHDRVLGSRTLMAHGR